MVTNKDKYNAIYDELESYYQSFILSVIPITPAHYYSISTNYIKYKDGYFIEERHITGIKYNHGVYRLEKPTRKDIERLKIFLEDLPEPTRDKILVCWKASNCSGATNLLKIGAENSLTAWKSEDLEPKLAQMIEKYSPKEGHVACSYCREQRKPEDIKNATIISRMWKHQNYTSPQRPYCKDKPCDSYDQMAHEG
jgi:hypothetical protein